MSKAKAHIFGSDFKKWIFNHEKHEAHESSRKVVYPEKRIMAQSPK
jgi:hypothetical protein